MYALTDSSRWTAPNGYEEVRFDNLEVFIYWSKGDYHVGAKATGNPYRDPEALSHWAALGRRRRYRYFSSKKNIPRRQRQRRPLP